MSIFDGLLAKVEGAVTSAEVEAAGLFTGSKATSPAAPQPRAAVAPSSGFFGMGGTASAPAPVSGQQKDQSSFSMVTSKIENFFGLGGTSPAVLSDDATAWAKDLERWSNILASLDKSMNAKNGASDLSSKVSVWKNGLYQDAQNKLSAYLIGSGDHQATSDAHDAAISEAKDLQKEIQDRWAKFAQEGAPSIADYVKAPITAPIEAAHTATAAAERGIARATKAVSDAAAPALSSTSAFLKYAPWIGGGLAALYVFSILPKGSLKR